MWSGASRYTYTLTWSLLHLCVPSNEDDVLSAVRIFNSSLILKSAKQICGDFNRYAFIQLQRVFFCLCDLYKASLGRSHPPCQYPRIPPFYVHLWIFSRSFWSLSLPYLSVLLNVGLKKSLSVNFVHPYKEWQWQYHYKCCITQTKEKLNNWVNIS